MKNLVYLIPSMASMILAGFVSWSGREKARDFVLIFVLLLVSFFFLALFYSKSKKFQDLLDFRPSERAVRAIWLAAFLFYLCMSFLFFGKHKTNVIGFDLDSISYYTQAKIFSAGKLSVPSHELKEFFTTGNVVNDGKFYSKYFPGWPLILSAGVKSGIPWVVNPLLGLMTLIVVYFTGKEIYDRDTAFLAMLLLLFSTNFYYLNTTYLSEPSSLLFSSLFFYFAVRTIKEPGVSVALPAGIFLGVSFLVRPYSAVAVALPVIGYFLYLAAGDRRKMMAPFFAAAAGALPSIAALLAYNHLQTGSFLVSPFEHYNPFDKLGFGLRSLDVFVNPAEYNVLSGIKNMLINVGAVNIVGILFSFIFLCFVAVRKKTRWDMLLLAIVFLIIVMHVFYHAKQSRYYHAAFFALALLTARGMTLSELSFRKWLGNAEIRNFGFMAILFAAITSVAVTMSPLKIYKRYKICQLYRQPYTLVESNNIHRSIIFVKSVPEAYNNISYYIQNPLDYTGDVLYVRDLGERNVELMNHYPNRSYYVYEYKRDTGTGVLRPIGGKEFTAPSAAGI
ncbi:MAG: glycosyltransferase family 39 protein [Deltaproteobacteria bacterium]|nr:glycosyltransferase family 39 protein [Deltaproteobacteria bacterium]